MSIPIIPQTKSSLYSLNILLDASGGGRIGDFGFSLELPKVTSDGRSLYTAMAFARSEGCYPPELARGMYSEKSDVYSYGVVGYWKLKLVLAACPQFTVII